MEVILEELSLNAWPAIRQVHFDNWVLRFSGGHTRRANSVNFLGPSSIPLAAKVGFCEEVYSRMGSATVFKFSGKPDTDHIDAFLADAGYRAEGNAAVMTRDLAQLPTVPDAEFRVESELSNDWFELAVEFTAVERSRRGHLERILSSIVPTHAFASVLSNGRPAAIALGVVERGWIGFFDIVTAPEFRRMGFATGLMANLMRWGADHGARHGYLQVVKENEAAMRLYEGLGFERSYEYWYRAKNFDRRLNSGLI